MQIEPTPSRQAVTRVEEADLWSGLTKGRPLTSRMCSQFIHCEPAHRESEKCLLGFWKKSSSQNRRSRRQAGSGTTSRTMRMHALEANA